MLLFGAGGHAKVIISCVIASENKVQAIFDDDLSKRQICNIAVTGSYDPNLFSGESLIIAIGDNRLRRILSLKIQHRFGIVAHPTAIIDKSVLISKGSVIMHGSIIQADSVIGNHVIVNTRVSIDHECRISGFVHLAPGVILCGNVHIGDNTLIGAGSVVAPNITVGSDCQIAAGSVITQNIPDGSIVRGNPGRIIRSIN